MAQEGGAEQEQCPRHHRHLQEVEQTLAGLPGTTKTSLSTFFPLPCSQQLGDGSLRKKSCSCRWLCLGSLWVVSGEQDACVRPLLYLNSLQRAVWADSAVFTHREMKAALKNG